MLTILKGLNTLELKEIDKIDGACNRVITMVDKDLRSRETMKPYNHGLKNGEPPTPYFDDDRQRLLSILDEAIDRLIRKIRDGRIKNPQTDKVRVQYYRALAYTCSVYNQVKQADEIEKLKLEIQTLKDQFRSYLMR